MMGQSWGSPLNSPSWTTRPKAKTAYSPCSLLPPLSSGLWNLKGNYVNRHANGVHRGLVVVGKKQRREKSAWKSNNNTKGSWPSGTTKRGSNKHDFNKIQSGGSKSWKNEGHLLLLRGRRPSCEWQVPLVELLAPPQRRAGTLWIRRWQRKQRLKPSRTTAI